MLKDYLKTHSWAMDTIAFVYNMVFSRCRLALLTGKIDAKGAFLKDTRIRMHGKGLQVHIGRMARLRRCMIIISGNNCSLEIGGGRTIITNTEFYEQDDNCSIRVGEHFTMEGGHIASTEGESIKIGEDCMFSSDVEIRNGDSHVIIEQGTRHRINRANPVTIGDHVWLTGHVRVLKGSVIPDNSIIANSSVVSGELSKPNCVYGGSPIRILKECIDWNRFRNKSWD